MGLFSSIGNAIGSVFGGGGNDVDTSNEVGVNVTSAPEINIDFDGLSAGIIDGLDEFGDDVGEAARDFSATFGFVVITAALIVVLGRR